MQGVYDIFKRQENDIFAITFKGEISKEFLNEVFSVLEKNIDSNSTNGLQQKRTYLIVVECLQNMYHHLDKEESEVDQQKRSGLFILRSDKNGMLQVVTGNLMKLEDEKSLRAMLDKINSMNPDQLKDQYLKILDHSKLSSKGGAGLGLIDIARKSGQKLDYEFTKVSDKQVFFSLTVTL